MPKCSSLNPAAVGDEPAGAVELPCAPCPSAVWLTHWAVTSAGRVKPDRTVKSAHYSQMNISILVQNPLTIKSGEGGHEAYLVELTITTSERHLDCHIRAIGNTVEAGKVERNAEVPSLRFRGPVTRIELRSGVSGVRKVVER